VGHRALQIRHFEDIEAPARQASPTAKGHEELSMIIYSQDGERTTLLALAPKLPWSRARSVAPGNGDESVSHFLLRVECAGYGPQGPSPPCAASTGQGALKEKKQIDVATYLPIVFFLGVSENIFMVFLSSSCSETAKKDD
jgi:hypothetical protein